MVPIWRPLNLPLIVLIAFTEMLMVKCCHVASVASVEIGVAVLSLPLLSVMLVGQWYRLPSPWAYREVTKAPPGVVAALSPAHSTPFGKWCVLWAFLWGLLI